MNAKESSLVMQEIYDFWPLLKDTWSERVKATMRERLRRYAYPDAISGLDKRALTNNYATPTPDDILRVIDEIDQDRRTTLAREALITGQDFGQQYVGDPVKREQDQRIAKEALAMIGAVLAKQMSMEDVAARCRILADEQPDLRTYWQDYATQVVIGN